MQQQSSIYDLAIKHLDDGSFRITDSKHRVGIIQQANAISRRIRAHELWLKGPGHYEEAKQLLTKANSILMK